MFLITRIELQCSPAVRAASHLVHSSRGAQCSTLWRMQYLCSKTSPPSTQVRFSRSTSTHGPPQVQFTSGHGSNLTLDGRVECDAVLMDGRTGDFGSVGAVSGAFTRLPSLPLPMDMHICEFRPPRCQEPHPARPNPSRPRTPPRPPRASPTFVRLISLTPHTLTRTSPLDTGPWSPLGHMRLP